MSLGGLSVVAFSFTCYSLILLNGHVPFFTISVLKSLSSLLPFAFQFLPSLLGTVMLFVQLSCADTGKKVLPEGASVEFGQSRFDSALQSIFLWANLRVCLPWWGGDVHSHRDEHMQTSFWRRNDGLKLFWTLWMLWTWTVSVLAPTFQGDIPSSQVEPKPILLSGSAPSSQDGLLWFMCLQLNA